MLRKKSSSSRLQPDFPTTPASQSARLETEFDRVETTIEKPG
jgi:hypothetical protein